MAGPEFKAPPSKGSRRAVLDAPSEGPATLAPSSSASESEKEEVFDAAVTPPPDGMKAVGEALQSISPDEPEDILNRMCPMCGWDQAVRNVVEPTQEDKDEFVVAAVSGERFKKVYPCYGGRLKITVRSRTYAETEAVMEFVTRWRKAEEIDTANAIIFKTYAYQALFSLEKIEFEGKDAVEYPPLSTEVPADGEESALEKVEKKIKEDFSDITWQSVQNAARHFDQLVSFLTLRAHDPNFWSRTATPV